MNSVYKKYLKYKAKYTKLKKLQLGGKRIPEDLLDAVLTDLIKFKGVLSTIKSRDENIKESHYDRGSGMHKRENT